MKNGHEFGADLPKGRKVDFDATADVDLNDGQESLSTLANGLLKFEPTFLCVFGKELFGFGMLVIVL